MHGRWTLPQRAGSEHLAALVATPGMLSRAGIPNAHEPLRVGGCGAIDLVVIGSFARAERLVGHRVRGLVTGEGRMWPGRGAAAYERAGTAS